MKLLIKTLRYLGFIWCGLSLLVMLADLVLFMAQAHGIWDALSRFQEYYSPHNIAHFLAVVVVFGPGALLIYAADRLKERRER